MDFYYAKLKYWSISFIYDWMVFARSRFISHPKGTNTSLPNRQSNSVVKMSSLYLHQPFHFTNCSCFPFQWRGWTHECVNAALDEFFFDVEKLNCDYDRWFENIKFKSLHSIDVSLVTESNTSVCLSVALIEWQPQMSIDIRRHNLNCRIEVNKLLLKRIIVNRNGIMNPLT